MHLAWHASVDLAVALGDMRDSRSQKAMGVQPKQRTLINEAQTPQRTLGSCRVVVTLSYGLCIAVEELSRSCAPSKIK